MTTQPHANGPMEISKPRKRRPRIRRRLIALGVLLAVPIGLTFCVGPPSYYFSKYAGPLPVHPAALPQPIEPEHQTEPHTCGLHALSSLYRAYGLDPERQGLRFRLGVDKPFNNLMADSLGSIHPDMLRVLDQDGFDCTMLLPGDDDDGINALTRHLDAGHLAVALTKVNEFHWVVLCGRDGDNVSICDSLKPDLATEPLRDFIEHRTYTLMLVRPK